MKKIIALSCFVCFLSFVSFSQNVGIGTNTPNGSAMLEVTATNKGVLVPGLTNAQMIAISSPANGLLLYNTDSACFTYRNGNAWVFLKGNITAGNDWSTKGNAGTDTAKNFIGTVDNADVIFKRNNLRAGLIGAGNTAFGTETLKRNPSGQGVIFFYKPSCDYCKQMQDKIKQANSFEAALQQQFIVQQIDITTAEGRAMARKYSIHAVPAIIQLDNASGNYHTINGFPGVKKLADMLHINYTLQPGEEQNTARQNSDGNPPQCGNGIIEAGEQCDDFNTTSGDGCSYNCQLEAVPKGVAINETGQSPDISSILDVSSNNKGVLIPRVTNNEMLSIAAPANGLLVYNTDVAAFAYMNGNEWVFVKGNNTAGNNWNTNGNGGTNPALDFIGTTDSMALKFRVKNINAGLLDSLTQNTAFGFRSLDAASASITGQFNTAVGYKAVANSSTGKNNTGIGANALRNTKSGNKNVALGYNALFSNLTANSNVAAGEGALYSHVKGDGNVAVGGLSLFSDSSGVSNTAVGNNALGFNYTGNANTALGAGALFNNAAGSLNLAVGLNALFSHYTGNDNVAVGPFSLYVDSNGVSNTAVGINSMASNLSGRNNAAFGSNALLSNVTGENNVAIGFNAGASATGNRNVFLGYNAGYFETESNKLYINNSDADSGNALIYGEFDNKLLQVNGKLRITAPANTIGLDIGNTAIKVSSTSPAVFTITATAATLDLVIPNTTMANSPTDILIVTHNLTTNKNISPGVYWTGSNWVIFLESGANHIVGEKFNVMVIKQ